jgi:malate permease and related proteins
MQNFVIIAVFLALGAICKRLFALPEKAPLYINHFVINVALPAVILLKLPQLPLNKTVLLPMLVPWLTALPLVATTVLLARRFGWPRDVIGALILLVLYGNSSYFGFPMVRAFFGDAAMPYAIMFDQLGNFIMLAVFAPIILVRFSASDKPVAALAVVRRIFSFPPFIALIAALLLNGIVYPPLIATTLSSVGLLLAPLAMFIVGLQLSWHVPDHLRQPLLLVLAMRLLLSPLLALLLCIVSNHHDLAARVTVFEAGMPTMVTAAIMAMSANLAPRLCTAAVGFGLGTSLLTLPLWFALTQGLFN